ncbi:MAG: inositol 2-dehydrogenase [Candidatus Hadarchaeum sp.]|uniref:inositol 2-dehydrogenase n=1 Tax=Candidatus Hadarchaeum sp. TaxID=2883567 RepID=UPI00317F2A9C
MTAAFVSVGLIGAGTIGKIHACNIAATPGARVVAIADPVKSAAERCAEEIGGAKIFDDYSQMLKTQRLDAVLVCSPGHTHARIVADVAGFGIHIFCEKPLGFTLAEIDAALDSVKQHRVKLQVGYNRRFDRNFQRVREIINTGLLGHLQYIRITSRDPQVPADDYLKVCGGLFVDTTSHDFDLVRFLTGEEVVEVFARGGVFLDPRVERANDLDTAVVFLAFESGFFGVVENSRRSAHGYDQRVEVWCAKGSVAVSNRLVDEVLVSDEKGTHMSPNKFFFPDRYKESFREEMAAFIRSVRDNKEPMVSGIDGKMAIAIALAAQESLKSGRPVAVSKILAK